MRAVIGAWREARGRYGYRLPVAFGCALALAFPTVVWLGLNDKEAPAGRTTESVALDEYNPARPVRPSVPNATGPVSLVPSPLPAGATGPIVLPPPPGLNTCPQGLDRGICTGFTGSTVRLGMHVPMTLACGAVPVETFFPEEPRRSLYLDYVNNDPVQRRRVFGRRLVFHEADDGACPEKAREAATTLLDEFRAFSVQGWIGTNANETVAEAAQGRAVPYLAGGGDTSWSRRWPVFHQNGASGDNWTAALMRFIKSPRGLNRANAKLGILVRDTPTTLRFTKRAVAAARMKQPPVFKVIEDNQPSFINEILAFELAKVDLVFCNCVFTDMVNFVHQADRAGPPKWDYTFASSGLDSDLMLQLLGPESSWVTKNTRGLSWMCHPDHPCADEYKRRLTPYLEEDEEITQLALYLAHLNEVWIEALHRAGPGLNRPRFIRALRSLDGWSSGLTAPFDFSRDRSFGVGGFALYEAQLPGNPTEYPRYKLIDVGGRPFYQW